MAGNAAGSGRPRQGTQSDTRTPPSCSRPTRSGFTTEQDQVSSGLFLNKSHCAYGCLLPLNKPSGPSPGSAGRAVPILRTREASSGQPGPARAHGRSSAPSNCPLPWAAPLSTAPHTARLAADSDPEICPAGDLLPSGASREPVRTRGGLQGPGKGDTVAAWEARAERSLRGHSERPGPTLNPRAPLPLSKHAFFFCCCFLFVVYF